VRFAIHSEKFGVSIGQKKYCDIQVILSNTLSIDNDLARLG